METCANPGCTEAGTNKCSGCKTTPYCGPICQTAHWPTHKESCDGRLRKMGMDHLNKARGFRSEHNWSQMLRHSDLAATKLKQLKDRPIEAISEALGYKCNALDFLSRYKEQLECAKEWYCLWNTKPTDPPALEAAFGLIGSCIRNGEFADAVLYASTLWEIINHKYDNKIPDDQRQQYVAKGASILARATLRLSQNGGVSSDKKQKTGEHAIALARQALEIHTQMYGADDDEVANDAGVLAELLDHFNNVDDDEVLRLYEQSKQTFARVFGSASENVGIGEFNLGTAYRNRATRARIANDLDRRMENLELALPCFRTSSLIHRACNHVDTAESAAQIAFDIEEELRQLGSIKAAAATRG